MLTALCDEGKYGTVLRAKGIVAPADSASEGWIHFDYVPGEPDVRTGARLSSVGCASSALG